MDETAYYICDQCGEQNIAVIDLSAGACQQYVEDCPVCCHPNLLDVRIDDLGQVQIQAEPEQDRF